MPHIGSEPRGASDHDQRALIRSTLNAVNRDHASRYSLVRRLPGGYQTGAYELATPDGEPAVLKLWTAPRPIERVREAAEAVAFARAAGWPTPAWLCWGLTPEGVPYEVQEFVIGEHLDRLDEGTLRSLLEVNDRQAWLAPPTRQEWSSWIRDVVYTDDDGILGRVAGFCPEGRRFAAVVDRLRRTAGAVEVPQHDLVCGVFSLENILFRDRKVVSVIDVQAIGRGSRAFDLATLYSRLSHHEREGPIGHRLRGAGEDVAGPRVFAVCLAAEFLGVLLFAVEHHSEGAPGMSLNAAHALSSLI